MRKHILFIGTTVLNVPITTVTYANIRVITL
jgi:hypothetical protein